jgi:protein HIRA/HIR1
VHFFIPFAFFQILQPFKVLGQSIHRSAVKGVSWDPIGKYLCSSGDDPAICVWRTFGDWGLEARIDASSGIFASGRQQAKQIKNPVPKVTTTLNDADAGTSHLLAGHSTENDDDDQHNNVDLTELANISLFRRISFAPDGSHLCATNATMRGKNIAAMISREGWAVSVGNASAASSSTEGGPKTPAGAANLVGHRQPIVASRHCPVLLSYRKEKYKKKKKELSSHTTGQDEKEHSEEEEEDDDEDAEPKSASLIALGDKRGFVTVWSTKASRPIFKMQVSDANRCTITDIAWAFRFPAAATTNTSTNQEPAEGMILLVSMLDGHIAAISFTWEELGGKPLSFNKKRRLFRLRYGIDLGNDVSNLMMSGRTLVGSTGPKFIESALQLTMEEDMAAKTTSMIDQQAALTTVSSSPSRQRPAGASKQVTMSATQSAEDTRSKQVESRKKGKKRIRPVLVRVDDDLEESAAGSSAPGTTMSLSQPAAGQDKAAAIGGVPQDPLEKALEVADKTSASAEELTSKKRKRATASPEGQEKSMPGGGSNSGAQGTSIVSTPSAPPHPNQPPFGLLSYQAHNTAMIIPPSTSNVFTTNLHTTTRKRKGILLQDPMATKSSQSDATTSLLSSTSSLDILAECTNSAAATSNSPSIATLVIGRDGKDLWKDAILGRCTALAASSNQYLALGTHDGTLYMFGTSPTIGFQSGIAFRSLPPLIFGSPITHIDFSTTTTADGSDKDTQMLILCSNGDFRLYSLKSMKVLQKGSVVPAFSHVRLAATNRASPAHQQQQQQALSSPKLTRAQITARGIVIILSIQQRSIAGGLHAFLYNYDMELWQRLADARFEASDLYTNLAMARRMGGGAAGIDVFGEEVSGATGALHEVESLVSLGSQTGLSMTIAFKNSSVSTWFYMFSSGSKLPFLLYLNVSFEFTCFIMIVIQSHTNYKEMITRAHCEDRISCSLALGSGSEFQHWIKLYARHLTSMSDAPHLRFLCDLVTGKFSGSDNDSRKVRSSSPPNSEPEAFVDAQDGSSQDRNMENLETSGECRNDGKATTSNVNERSSAAETCANENLKLWWWLGSQSDTILGLKRNDLIQVIVAEMGRNRELQRLTNEVSMELDAL